MMAERRVLVVGGGHNGLICACYLARAGLDVTVLEQRAVAGGAVHTEERLPGYRFDTCSVAHNMLNLTDIIQDLDLARYGLRYQEMDPFTIAPQANGRPPLRFLRRRHGLALLGLPRGPRLIPDSATQCPGGRGSAQRRPVPAVPAQVFPRRWPRIPSVGPGLFPWPGGGRRAESAGQRPLTMRLYWY